MPIPKYPLEPLHEHRKREVDDATAALGRAIQQREAAEAARASAQRAHGEAESRAAALRAEEAKHLESGELRAVDLARGNAWETRAHSEIAVLATAVEAAETKEARSFDAEERSRKELAEKMADRDVVAKDANRFAARWRERALQAEEESAEEARAGRVRSIEGKR